MISTEYVAGFFDGEGSVMSFIPNGGGHLPAVTVAQLAEQRGVLDAIVERWGGHVCVDNKPRPCARLWIKSESAQRFLKDVLPFLRVKRKQAQLALVMCQMVASRRNNSGRRPTQRVPEGEKYLRARLATAIKNLNHGRAVGYGL